MEEGCSTLVRSLEQKYLDDDEDIVQDIIFTGFTGCSPCKMASQRALELLVLNNMNIDTIGDSEKLATLASHVSEADLGWNQISKWSDIACILKNLPHLRVLNIGHNPLNPVIDHELPVSTLHTIILNVLPKVTELHMSDNQFNDDDDCDEPISTTVRTVHLNRCGFLKWSSVMNVVKRFPNVCSVFVCENPLKDVTHCKHFEQLPFWNFLNLAKTSIDSWDSLDQLNRMTSISDLRVPNIPLLDALTNEERLHLIIGRLHHLRVLNGSKISSEQREQSERFFIRYYQEQKEKPLQYKTLIDKHGNLEKLVTIDLTPKKEAVVKILCEEKEVNQEITISLEPTVLDFMKILDPKVGVKFTRMKLFLLREDGRTDDFSSSDYNMPLHYFKIEDGDSFLVQEKIIVTRRRRPPSSTSSSSS
ncbi:Tubulin-specific chaperone cofactor E-like protein [Caenorhabditis elegans]|uniref:Isoform b of Tubulin-specific chaperone cofactor E-like protein n=1 Tax=Caenorhabditis elegans TaxID=6239 RepID=H2KYZ5-2|nr:Tubulin-specific chaperone cofactor E-like protein [Caenorhabditis elegans]CCD65412.1 Tubulin-specific chaperone cofactor E-like protein [Caenorhabditis elegans]|eukprot:NP_741765.1 tubulin folding COfactor E-Like protein [Caenorhabditis elegans]